MASNQGKLCRDLIGGSLQIASQKVLDKDVNLLVQDAKIKGNEKVKGNLTVFQDTLIKGNLTVCGNTTTSDGPLCTTQFLGTGVEMFTGNATVDPNVGMSYFQAPSPTSLFTLTATLPDGSKPGQMKHIATGNVPGSLEVTGPSFGKDGGFDTASLGDEASLNMMWVNNRWICLSAFGSVIFFT